MMTNSAKKSALILILMVMGAGTVWASDTDPAPAVPATAATTAVTLIVGRSTVVDVGTPITRVSLTNSEVADALVTSASQLLVHGKVPGSISMFVWDRGGEIRRYEVDVQRDLEKLKTDVAQLMPGQAIDVRGNGRFVVLSGTVSTKDVMERAVNLATGYVDKKDEVVSLLQVNPDTRTDQVLLKVRFAEVSRAAITDYGISLFTSPTGINNTLGRVTTQQFASP